MTRLVNVALALLIATANLTVAFASVEREASALVVKEFAADVSPEAVELVEDKQDRRQLSWVLSFFTTCEFMDVIVATILSRGRPRLALTR